MTYYNQFLTCQDRQYIFQNLTLSPDLKAEHTALDSFYTATVNTNIGLIESIALRIDTIQTWTYFVAALDSSEADTIYTVDSTAKAARAAYVDATLTINSGIVPAFVIETNHKTLNNLQLNFLKLLTDLTGRTVYRENLAAGNEQITVDLSSLQAGSYICRLSQNHQLIGIQKLILIR